MRIFFAGPLTDLKNPDQIKAFYVKLADMVRSNGLDFFWAFLNGTDPVKNPEVTPQYVYDVDTKELSKSDIMVAYVGEPSTGTGIEIEFAKNHNIPVFLLYEKGKRISRMLRGCPAVSREIIFESEKDALKKLESALKEFKTNS
ncbi:nucleoside 2-deoxyribosyltransferase [Patescibacteria group bacterium]|nr:nucleoside 2-deoxyribosyltransferase [Patescibacteria group bacterium]MBU1472956.1 nucleoside 2-deoxyribosyltransferase [Patescibacteria group bacterium]MBU2459696.1 nucleoside 2-deoxyribosyltransferase [Patescibacteria group bacterium]MBU2544577.1 nucleoside 2-deoxyribosyltransferase [Patescibacteria group bacterium]